LSALDDWQTERERLRIGFTSKWGAGRQPRDDGERDELSRDFQAYMDNTKVVWRVFAAAEPGMAAEMFSRNMQTISTLSARHR
jgi:hypothetical protein